MKKRYQIEQQRAVQQFRRLATEQNPTFRWCCHWPRSSVCCSKANLLRQTGLELMYLVMDEEVKSLAGRELHRGQPGEGEGTDGAPQGELRLLRRTDRRDAFQGPSDDRSPRNWLRRPPLDGQVNLLLANMGTGPCLRISPIRGGIQGFRWSRLLSLRQPF